MANHDPLTGYPYGAKAPFPHGSANEASERIVKSHNADEGSAHAPTGTSAWSGAMGFGWSFADAFPFAGDLDVTDGVTFDAPSSGSIIFGKLVAVDVRGPLSFKAGTAGAPGSAQWESGTSATFLSGSSLTLASGATMALTGNTTVRGSLTIKASGGPGSLVIEAGTTNQLAGTLQILSTAIVSHTAGSQLTGTTEDARTTTRSGATTRTARTTLSGATARTAHRAVEVLADADADMTVAFDRYELPTTQAANRVFTLRHTGTVPVIGERIRVTRIFTGAPSAYTAKMVREDATILFSFYNSMAGDAEFEYTAGGWKPIAGYQTLVTSSGFYDL